MTLPQNLPVKQVAPIRVAFRPPADGLGGDRFFFGSSYSHFGDASHWLEPTRFLAASGRVQGIEFHTDDMVAPEDAAVFIFGEVPSSRAEVQTLRRKHPHLKLVLHIVETPIGRDWAFDLANHGEFDAVASYHPRLDDGKRYFSFRIPAGGLEAFSAEPGPSWEDRKIACMIANVPNARPVIPRRSGIGMIRNGWKFTPQTWWSYIGERGSLYGERLHIARQFEDMLGGQFDIFGPGWPRPGQAGGGKGFASAHGTYEGNKLDLLKNYRFTVAYENCRNDCGYITEKLFDALLAGCVPIYLGNESIRNEVGDDVIVDAREFRTRHDLVTFVGQMPKAQWQRMRDAGAAFLLGKAKHRFGSEQYAKAIIDAVRRIT